MIARRAGENSGFPLGVGQRAYEIDAPAHLERTSWLMILVFKQELATQQLGKPRPIEKRGRSENATHAGQRLDDICIGHRWHLIPTCGRRGEMKVALEGATLSSLVSCRTRFKPQLPTTRAR